MQGGMCGPGCILVRSLFSKIFFLFCPCNTYANGYNYRHEKTPDRFRGHNPGFFQGFVKTGVGLVGR